MSWNPTTLRRPAKVLATVAIVALASAALAGWGVPALLRWAVAGQVPAWLGREVRLADSSFNPFTWRLTLQGLAVAGAQPGDAPLLTAEQLVLDFSARSLLLGAPVLEAVELQAPHLRLARLADGHYDLDDLIQRFQSPAQPEPAATEPPRFALYNLRLSGGEIDFDDRPKGRQHQVRALSIALPFVSTLSPQDIQVQVRPQLAFALDGSPWDAQAELTPFDPRAPEALSLKLDALELAPWAAYLPASLPLHPQAGQLSLALKLRFEQGERQSNLRLSGQLQLKGLQLRDAQDQEALSLGRAELALADLRWPEQQAELSQIELDDLHLPLRRQRDGLLQTWQGSQGSPTPQSGQDRQGGHPAAQSPATGAGAPAAQAPGWKLKLARLQGQRWQVDVTDEAVQPSARWSLALPSLTLAQLQWPVPKVAAAGAPVAQPQANSQTQLQTLLQWADGQGQPIGHAELQGEWGGAGGQIQVKLAELALAPWQAYLGPSLRASLAGQLGGELLARWEGAPGEQLPQLSAPLLQIDQLRLRTGLGKGSRQELAWQSLALVDGQLDLQAHKAQLGELRWQGLDLWAQRDLQGQLNLAAWWQPQATAAQPAPAASPAPSSAARPEWQLLIQQATLAGGKLRWRDEASGGEPVALDLEGIQLHAQPLHWPARPADRVALRGSLRMGAEGAAPREQGRMAWQGELGMQPLVWRGSLQLAQLPLPPLAPYGLKRMPLTLSRAALSGQLKGEAKLAEAGPSAAWQGDLRLEDLQLRSLSELASAEEAGGSLKNWAGGAGGAGDASELLGWHSLALNGLNLNLAPGQPTRLEIAGMDLNEFFARLVVTPEGRLNFNDLNQASAAAPSPAQAPALAEPPAQPAAAALAGASSPQLPVQMAIQVPQVPQAPAQSPLILALGGARLNQGRIDFADRFVRPNYRTELSELNGSIGAFRTDAPRLATLNLRGKAAGTAALEVQGTFSPSAKPLQLDIQAKASDLELAPLSPYAGKYAGYAIERGKLSMDLNYLVQPDGRLQARNQLLLQQLTFGERIESPDATQLPVQLAVALLKDRHGVIDLNLPISGSINEPEFSVGRLLWQVITNLLSKAITAPFSLLGGGAGEQPGWIEFEPGTARPVAASATVLDGVARALADRPQLRLTVAGAADLVAERQAMQAAALEARLRAEQRKLAASDLAAQREAGVGAGIGAGLSPGASEPPAWQPQERLGLLKRVYADTRLPNKPRNLLGLAKDLPEPEMEALLRTAIAVDEEAARDLALRRGVAVRDALMARGLPNQQLFLAAPRLHAEQEPPAAWAPRANLTLGVD